jgi:hypothetical protein
MNLTLLCIEAHPSHGKEVMVVDDVDVNVCLSSISSIFKPRERMGT